jgi:hypothetical protein
MMHFLIFFHDNNGPKHFHEVLLLLLDDVVGVTNKLYNSSTLFHIFVVQSKLPEQRNVPFLFSFFVPEQIFSFCALLYE